MAYAEIVRAHYFHELDRRKEIDAGLAIPLGVLTAIFAVLGTMFGSLDIPLTSLEIAIVMFGAGATISAFISAVYLMRTFLGFWYKRPTSMRDLGTWRNDVVQNGASEEEADQRVESLMTEQYAIAADHNCLNNDRKAAFKYNSIFYASVSLCLVVTSAVPYLLTQMIEEPLQSGMTASTVTRLQQKKPNEQRKTGPASAASSSADAGRTGKH